jgi:hypothetical protein
LREAAFSEGPAGVANAIKNLWQNIGRYASSLASYIASGGVVPTKHTSGGEPIGGRDLIALLATIGVDLGLLALAILNPPGAPSRMPPADERRQIRAAVATAISRAPGASLEWVRRHFIYHKGASYLVIPNLASCDSANDDECRKALAMNQLAGVLDDLDLVRWPQRGKWWLMRKGELEVLKKEEGTQSDTDLTKIRQEYRKNFPQSADKMDEGDRVIEKAQPLRNHGLFSKAESALIIAGWSEKARRDIEIFRLVDVEGLTPILMVLNEDGGAAAPRDDGPPAEARA